MRASPPGLGDDLDSVHGPGAPRRGGYPWQAPGPPLHRRATRILFDHTGFPAIDEMFRIVTLGWAQMLPRLQRHTKTGEPAPCFEF